MYSEDVASALMDRGHRVRVITGYPNYPDGEIFPGYRQQWRSRERHLDVPVLRVPLFIDHSQSALRRLLNYASFAGSAASARAYARKADVIYVYAPQMTSAFGPWLWRMLGGPPYVVHVQDLWPDSIVGSSIASGAVGSSFIPKVLNPWLRSVYRRAGAVIGIAPNMKRMLIERGAPAVSTRCVYNWPDSQVLAAQSDMATDVTSLPPAKRARTRLIFAGNTGDMQDLETVVQAAHQCAGDDIEVMIVGSGVELATLKALAAELGATNILFTGSVPSAEISRYYATSDFGLVTLKDLPIFRGTIPSKLQRLLAEGLPIITTVQGDAREIVEQNGVGFATEPGNPELLAATFRRAASLSDRERAELSARAADTYRAKFSFERAMDEIEQILVAAARTRRGRRNKKESRDGHE